VKEPEMPALDLAGFALSGVGLSVLMLGLSSLGGHLLPGKITAACIILGALALAAYPWHARRVAHPVIDLALLELPTFHTGVIAGSLFRIGVGATPFLLPLLLQLGFGMNPLQSGLLTCATAVGAMFMKTLTTIILRQFGFRKVLTVNALVASAAIAVFGLFSAATPHVVIFLVLLASGCLRSLQFTALQAISFAEVTRDHEPGLQHRQHGAASRAEPRRGGGRLCPAGLERTPGAQRGRQRRFRAGLHRGGASFRGLALLPRCSAA